MDLKGVLELYGFQLKSENQTWWRAQAAFRDGNNKTAVRIHKKSGRFIDFVDSKAGDFRALISLSLGRKITDEDYHKIITENQVELEQDEDIEIVETEKSYPISDLDKLLPNFSFYMQRGISKETLKAFWAGYAEGGSMSGRCVFPIFDLDGEKIIGYSGRKVVGDESVKWKHLGRSNQRIFPACLPSRTAKIRKTFPAQEAIKETGDIILIESIGDCLGLWENGIKNTAVTFGTKLSSKLCAFIASQGLKRIIIATNNDIKSDGGENVGERAAIDFFIQLSSLVSYNKIVIHLPQNANDFGDMQKEGRGAEIEEWYRSAPAENTVEMKKKILARMRELYKEKKLSTQAVKMAKEIKEEIEENEK